MSVGSVLFRICFVFTLIFSAGPISGCSLLTKKEEPDIDLKAVTSKPLSPEETKEMLSDVGGNWFYGQGLGGTAVAAGATIAFPPYALVLLGNAALSVSGYEPIGVSTVLPEKGKESWTSFYDGVTSTPGRVTAAVAGEDFRDEAAIKERMKHYTERYRKPDRKPASL